MIAKRLLAETGPLWLAGLLYFGAGLGLTLVRAVARRWKRGAQEWCRHRRLSRPVPAALGHRIKSRSNAEVVLHAWQCWESRLGAHGATRLGRLSAAVASGCLFRHRRVT